MPVRPSTKLALGLGSGLVVGLALVLGSMFVRHVRERETLSARPPAVDEALPSAAPVPAAPVQAASPDDASMPVVDAAPASPRKQPDAPSEAQLMTAAAEALARSPAQTLALIEQADRRFGTAHEGRRVLEIEALVGLERIGMSHAKAEQFYRLFPDSGARARIERLTGYHPRPWGPK